MSEKKLNKCRCGGKAIVREDKYGMGGADKDVYIECSMCGMQTRGVYAGWSEDDYDEAVERVTLIWNEIMK